MIFKLIKQGVLKYLIRYMSLNKLSAHDNNQRSTK